ncbi:alkaline phosphatase family protein [Mucilaginibacter sp. FT3.2]|uniref:alkaline phosphatase family protein n=1 Tax=Mucilaginibacter sp. FT3.2 TaxID=2723090 RepID=UPI001613F2E1|nr:alkaline phosphatase family protein [Mucilaginibacter sp. FT3.2]
MPAPDHIIVVVEENHGYSEIVNSPNAPFFNQLIKEGALFTNSSGVAHPSQPNYLVLFSGSLQEVLDDRCLEGETPYDTDNLGAELLSHNLSFKGYAQSMPYTGYSGCDTIVSPVTNQHLFARKHAPWINWQGEGVNGLSPSLSLPMTKFPTDFNKLPTVAFVIPDMDNDMHNIGATGDAVAIQKADKWLKDNLSAFAKWAKIHNSLLIITFDEDDYKTDNIIPTVIFGDKIQPGKYNEKINHFNILHTIEAMYRLPVKDTSAAKPVTDIWKQ